MTDEATPTVPDAADARSLAASLAPVIVEACEGRLSDIRWFKADWQRGGSATATARFTREEGGEAAVVIKLPVGPRELIWTRRLQTGDEAGVVARLYASGAELAGYDLAWIVIERFEHGPLGRCWTDTTIPRICDAAARFYAQAAEYPVNQPPRSEDWPELLKASAKSVRTNKIEHHQRWSKAIKALRAAHGDLVEEWRARDAGQWVHGDLHLANAMCRAADDDAPVSLIDLNEIHAGNWIEDAVYLERQLWAVPDRLKAQPPVKTLAKARKAVGLPVEREYPRLAMIRRALLAATAPKFIRSEGHPRYLEACLTRLEQALDDLK